jgi:hypothetical protein
MELETAMTDPLTIARGLTKAQQFMMQNMPPRISCDWRTFPSLKRRGLCVVRQKPSGMSFITLTPLGLAVRDALLKMENGPMTDRERMFALMQRGSVRGIESGTSVYGVPVESMNEAELRICLLWALSQVARVNLHTPLIGVAPKETQQ